MCEAKSRNAVDGYENITEALGKGRILVLDGAMGTMLQSMGLCEADYRSGVLAGSPKELKGDNECLNLTRPDVVRRIHDGYIAAGADIIETNTFGANSIVQDEYGCAQYAGRMALEGARIARAAADEAMLGGAGRRIYVAGSVGPTSKSLSMSPDMDDPAFRAVSFDCMAAAYREQIKALLLGGVDLLMLETCFDALNVKAALYALWQVLDDADVAGDIEVARRLTADGHFPVIVSATVSDRSGRTLTGQTLEAFYTSVSHYPLTAFGLNCSLGADEMYPLVKEIAGFAGCAVSCHPNAGLPDGMGGYGEAPADMARAMGRMAADGLLNIAGGCCGTTPEYIRAIAGAVSGCKPRPVVHHDGAEGLQPLVVSGLEAVGIDLKTRNFTNVGERTNVAGSRKFARVVASGDYAGALRIAADQVEAGADIIDINMDDAMLDSTAEMTKFVRYVAGDPAVARAALMIDSSHWDTIVAGLKNAQGKSIVNSISLKEGEAAFLAKAGEIRRLGAAMVVMAFDEKGQATDFDRKVEICSRAYRLLTERVGIQPRDIIFDVNVLAVGTGIEEHAGYAVDFIKAVRWIKDNLPGALTSGGISNLSFAFRGNNPVREAMHSAFLYHAIRAGLDMAIVNPGMLQVYDEIEPALLKCVEDVILNADSCATERLVAKAGEIAAAKSGASGGSSAGVPGRDAIGGTPAERVMDALVKGKSDNLGQDLADCLAVYGSAVNIIEGPLMDGMKRVGELFGDGKMFLPQVVKSARVMKEAVDILQPYMETGADGTADGNGRDVKDKPRIVVATVRGDVHDIGKNITAIVLGCNGFDVVDLGVMVDKEKIIDTAIDRHADIVAVSGLITPSLYQMEELCREMERRGMDVPLLIGGATTSALHTAVKLAPLYGHVFYGSDASATAVKAKRCMVDRAGFEVEEHGIQERIRRQYGQCSKQGNGSAPCENVAGEGRDVPAYGVGAHPFARDSYLDMAAPEGIQVAEISICDVVPYFDWKMFYSICGVKYGTLDDGTPCIDSLKDEAMAMIDRFSSDGLCRIVAGMCWFDAYSDADAVCFRTGRGVVSWPMMRQERPASSVDGRKLCLSLSDFVSPKDYGFTSPMGIFAVSVDKTQGGQPGNDGRNMSHDDLLGHAVMNTLAEAASSWLENKVKNGVVPGDDWRIIKPAPGYASCPDHTLKRDILSLLPGAEKLGISLTDSCGMLPEASICGLVFIHKYAVYPEIRRVSYSQVADYAVRRGMTHGEARRFLGYLVE